MSALARKPRRVRSRPAAPTGLAGTAARSPERAGQLGGGTGRGRTAGPGRDGATSDPRSRPPAGAYPSRHVAPVRLRTLGTPRIRAGCGNAPTASRRTEPTRLP